MASLHIFISLLVLSLFNLSEEKPSNQIAKRDATIELGHLGHSFGEANLGELVNNHRVKRSPKDDSSEESAESAESEESEESMEGSADDFFRVKRSPAPQKDESSEESAESEESEESMEGSGDSSSEED